MESAWPTAAEASLALGKPGDIPAIMAIERTEGYAGLVGRWSEAEHRKEFESPESRYLVMRRQGSVVGFAILQDLANRDLCVSLRRLAVAEAGRGTGAGLVRRVVDHVFSSTPAHRLQLRVFVDNVRARRCYAGIGFVDEGVLRDCVLTPAGTFRSMHVMSVLRTEWTIGQG